MPDWPNDPHAHPDARPPGFLDQLDLCKTARMTEYTPSKQLQTALEELKKAQALVDERRNAAYAAAANDLKSNPGLTVYAMEDHVPWSAETLRQISRVYDVPRRRKATTGREARPAKRGPRESWIKPPPSE